MLPFRLLQIAFIVVGVALIARAIWRRRQAPDARALNPKLSVTIRVLGVALGAFVFALALLVARSTIGLPQWLETPISFALYASAAVCMVSALLVGWFAQEEESR